MEKLYDNFHTQAEIQDLASCVKLTLLKSLVKTPEASPYSVPLALFKTPSTSLQISKTARLMPKLMQS